MKATKDDFKKIEILKKSIAKSVKAYLKDNDANFSDISLKDVRALTKLISKVKK